MRGELRYRSSVLLLALALCAAPAAVADRAPPPDVREIPIEIPDPTPTGLLLAWKPTVLSVRLDTGTGDSKFGSESFEPGRGLARFTFQAMGAPGTPAMRLEAVSLTDSAGKVLTAQIPPPLALLIRPASQ